MNIANEETTILKDARFYKQILDSTWDWEYLSCTFEKKLLYVSPSAPVHTGYSAQELLDNFDLLAKMVHPDDANLWNEHLAGHVCLHECIAHSFLSYRIITKNGELKWMSHICVPFYDSDGRYLGRRVSNRDITEQKKAEEAFLDHTKRYENALLENIPDMVWLKNNDGEILTCNPSFEKFVGKSKSEIIGKKISTLECYQKVAIEMTELDKKVLTKHKSAMTDLSLSFEDGQPIWAEVTKSPVYDKDGTLIGIVGFARDVTDARNYNRITEARNRLHKFASEHNLHDLLVETLDEAEALSDSKIGFYHFLGEDQKTLSFQAWSTRTTREFCHTEIKESHCGIDMAGVWADCIRERKAIMHNDYPSLAHKKGLPEGRAMVARQMLIPVFRGENIVAIMGIGNKSAEYSQKDLEVASLLADFSWDIVLQKKREEELNLLAHYDALTRLPNRVMLSDRLQHAIAHSKRTGELLAVCVMDLDGFKPVNDTYGHKAGDLVLQETAKRLLGCVRSDDTVARLGGDEFVLSIGGLKNLKECEVALDRIVAEVAKPIEVAGGAVVVHASIGATFFPLDGADKDTLMRHADQAMYEAKESGKNRYCFFDHAHEQKIKANQGALKKIKKALSGGEFCLYYQPKVDCRAGEVVGLEALIRWKHPLFGVISPAQFLPLMEHDEAIIEMGEFVLREAIKQMNIWAQMGIALPVSVNIAAKHLRRSNFFESLSSIAQDCKYDPDKTKLEIEIIETAALEDIVTISEIINQARTIGVGFSLDDFGTGYSSLTHLKNMRVDTLKIDQSFIVDMLEDAEDLAIAEGIIALANAFDRKVIAEGVESIDHILLLLEIGCDVMQGYTISKPLPAERVDEWLKTFTPDPRWLLASTPRPNKCDFHLLLAEANIRHWVDMVVSVGGEFAQGKTPRSLPQLDVLACRFGQWYEGEGMRKYGEFEEFRALKPMHDSLHFFAKETMELAIGKDHDSFLQNKDELLRIASRLISMLHSLKKVSAEIRERNKKRSKHG